MTARGMAARGAIALGLSLALAAPALAAGAEETTITITVLEDETFTTTGDVLCDSGTATTYFGRFGGSEAGAAGSFHGEKLLECDDDSGTFIITFDAGTVFGSPQDQGGWHVVSGTGDYSTLIGGGNLVGTYIEGGIVDQYTGRVKV